jgi:hypothetical protein
MKQLLLFLALLFAVTGIILTVLPLETLALIPVGLSLFMAYITMKSDEIHLNKISKWILIIAVATLLVVVAKELNYHYK